MYLQLKYSQISKKEKMFKIKENFFEKKMIMEIAFPRQRQTLLYVFQFL